MRKPLTKVSGFFNEKTGVFWIKTDKKWTKNDVF